MADPRLNSLHLETARRQEFRRARNVLLGACGSRTLCASRLDEMPQIGNTIIPAGPDAAQTELTCWLSDGDFIYPLQVGVNTLGRSSENNVQVDDGYVSRRHCAILIHSSETAELHDTASKNGTYLNGARLTNPAVLKSGDEIRICSRPFVFRTKAGDPGLPSYPATLSG